jgi:transcriptional regulator with XRE-family HTH domain
MGRKARPTPARLCEKLLQIRTTLGLSQSEMFRRLEVDDLITHKQISKYELGITEPPLPVILQYAHVAGVSTDVLIDDRLDLPAKLPATRKRS